MLALTLGGNTEYLSEDQQENAMQRYWEARQQGDQTAQLVKLDGDPPRDSDPTPGGAVSPIARNRIAEQERCLDDNGFAVEQPLFAPGTRVRPLGDDNFRIERQRVENLPKFCEAADLVRAQIATEQRDDHLVGTVGVHMLDSGEITAGGQQYALSHGSFSQLATLSGFGSGTRYLAQACDQGLRKHNVNTQLQTRRSRRVVLRTRRQPMGSNEVFAVVTPSYAAVDSDQVLGAVTAALSDAHVEMRYDGSGVRATAYWMPDHVVDLAAGDIFKVGVRIETDDTGRGRIRISGVVFRNLCLNLIIIGQGEVETVSQVHRGDPDRILSVVREGVDAARDKVGDFLEAWGHARTVKVDAQTLIRQWVEDRKLQVPGVRGAAARDRMVDMLLLSWQTEPDDTLAGAVNAVTRAAHENPFWGIDIREELERQAASLVMVPR